MLEQKQQEKLESFEHLSHVDLDDAWLSQDKGSIIESIENSRAKGLHVESDYSAIEFNELISPQTQIVKTKTDIFIQDDIMQKIIKYISWFSEDF